MEIERLKELILSDKIKQMSNPEIVMNVEDFDIIRVFLGALKHEVVIYYGVVVVGSVNLNKNEFLVYDRK